MENNNSLIDNEKSEPVKKIHGLWWKVGINVLAMIVVSAILLWLGSMWLDIWTHHGEFVEVPEVKNQDFFEAKSQLELQGFDVVLSDSIYDTTTKPGTVLSQNPKCGAKVKDGRTVYLTVNAFSPRLVTLPNLTDVSLRQAQSTLEGLGIKKISVEYVPSDYKDLVISVKRDGKVLMAGSRIPVASSVVLEVGQGMSSESSEAADSSVVNDALDLI